MSEVAQPRYGKATVNGLELAWVEWGPGEASAEKTILGIHGITANLHNWDSLAPLLVGEGYRLIGFDLRGRGDSSKPDNGYNPACHAADALGLLDYFGLDRVNVVGHSLGAVIGLYFTAHYPERVRKLVLIDHGMDTAADARATIQSTMFRLGKVFGSLEEFLNLYRNSPIYKRWTPELEAFFTYDVEVRQDGTVMSKVLPSAVEEEFENLYITEFLPSQQYAGIKVPTLILKAMAGTLDGGKSGFILSEEGAKLAASKIEGAKLVEIPEVNHYTITLDPTPQVAQELINFLQ